MNQSTNIEGPNKKYLTRGEEPKKKKKKKNPTFFCRKIQ